MKIPFVNGERYFYWDDYKKYIGVALGAIGWIPIIVMGVDIFLKAIACLIIGSAFWIGAYVIIFDNEKETPSIFGIAYMGGICGAVGGTIIAVTLFIFFGQDLFGYWSTFAKSIRGFFYF